MRNMGNVFVGDVDICLALLMIALVSICARIGDPEINAYMTNVHMKNYLRHFFGHQNK